jgi:hypothetical protein
MLVRRLGERGGKRASYEVPDNYEGMLTEPSRLPRFWLSCYGLVREASHREARSSQGNGRVLLVTREAMETAGRRWRQRPGT